MPGEILALPGERYAATGAYWRSTYLWLALQLVSSLAMLAGILALTGERDATTGEYCRSQYLCLAPQRVSPVIASQNICFAW